MSAWVLACVVFVAVWTLPGSWALAMVCTWVVTSWL